MPDNDLAEDFEVEDIDFDIQFYLCVNPKNG